MYATKYASRTKDTSTIESPWMRCLLHGEIDSLKTTTAALFGTPEQTRIILTREEDQLLPIINRGYKFLQSTNGAELTEMMAYCDQIWPDWAKHPEPYLVIDDMTKGNALVFEDSDTDDKGNAVKDIRRRYGITMESIAPAFNAVNRKSIHICLTALSKVAEGKITKEENVIPDLPPSIGNFIMSDYSFIFFLNRQRPVASRMLTRMDFMAITEYDEKAKKDVTYRRYFFARNKVPSEVAETALQQYEPANLRAVWDKVKAARKVAK